MHRGATEARTGRGWDAVTEMLPVFVGRRNVYGPTRGFYFSPCAPI
jgi:hypothetical protein